MTANTISPGYSGGISGLTGWNSPANGGGACATLPEVGGVFYNRVPQTYMTPDINNPHVHGPAFVF